MRLSTSALVALVALSTAALPARAAEPAFIQAPYVQLPAPDGVTILWAQEPAGEAEVQVGLPGAAADVVLSSAAAARHEVEVAGLQPATRYEYRVALHGGQTSEPASFLTAPPVGSAEPFRWALFGDTRSSVDAHAATAAAIAAEENLAFGVQTGDMVSSGEVSEQWDQYFSIEHPLMRGVPIFPVIGNHDEYQGEAAELVARFAAPRNSPRPEHYYSFRYANAWFTVLDTHASLLDFEGCLAERDLFVLDCMTPEQVAWVADDLLDAVQADGVDHIFVLVHVGPYSSKENRSGSMDVRRLLPLFQAMGVRAVLSGHDHYYERGLSAFGMPYIISGGAGAGLYELSEPSSAPHEVHAGESSHHHVVVDVLGPTVTFTARRVDGSVLDTFALTAPAPECATDEDCEAAEPPPECVAPGSCSVAGRCAFDCPIEGANPFPELRGEGAEAADGADASEGDADADADTDADTADEHDSGPIPIEPDSADEDPSVPPAGDSGCGAAPGAGPPLALLLLGAWWTRRRRVGWLRLSRA